VTVQKVLIKIIDKTGVTVYVSSLMYPTGSVCAVTLGTVCGLCV